MVKNQNWPSAICISGAKKSKHGGNMGMYYDEHSKMDNNKVETTSCDKVKKANGGTYGSQNEIKETRYLQNGQGKRSVKK